MSHPPLVLVHGLWNTPRLFNRLISSLAGRREPLIIPHLPHGLGHVPLDVLVEELDRRITSTFGHSTTIDLLGFSMGGLLARSWIHRFGGHYRTRRLLCVGSPQRGTLSAQLMPKRVLAGIADMKIGSSFLRQLADCHARTPQQLDGIDCRSYYCPIDLMVIPSWRGVLPSGTVTPLPALGHLDLLRHPRCIQVLTEALLES